MAELQINKSKEFLNKWNEKGPWVLTAINPDTKEIKTLTCVSLNAVGNFVEKYGDTRNIYFHVNTTKTKLTNKAKKEDIASMDWLHVDVDPRVGEDIYEEQQRAISLLKSPPENIPPPTFIVFSGGGYQGFWKLEEPVNVNGDTSLCEKAERYNKQLEITFGGDHCHNVDRIMRLPGTINWPDQKKRKKGRSPVTSELIEHNPKNVYPLSRFMAAPEVQSTVTGFEKSKNVQISGNIARVSDLNTELPEKVSTLCKVIIAQGKDPDNPDRFPSRSEALFYVCCHLVKAECDNELIFSIITDPDFRISASVLESKDYEKYAIRQIERAREYAVDPNLMELNAKHAVIRSYGGKPRVIEEVYDEILDRYRLTKSTFEDFRNGYCNKKIVVGEDKNGNPIQTPLGKWWLEHPERRSYERLQFAPGRDLESDIYNLWRGFGVSARSGEKHLSFMSHIYDNICDGKEELFNYVVGWLANAVQNPDSPGQTAIVLRGDQGVGKGFFASTIGKLFGRHYFHVANAHHLTGNFNAHLRDCSLLFADEAFFAGDKKHASVLKVLVTEDAIIIEPKGVDSEMCGNCIHLLMASNEDWVVPAGMNERRFCVLDVASKKIQDSSYFSSIAKELEDGGYENLLQHLLTYDLSNFNLREIPKTKALQEQKIFSYSNEEEWWYQKLLDGQVLSEHSDWQGEVYCKSLVSDYITYTRMFNSSRRGSATKVGKFLTKAVPGIEKVQSSDIVTIENEDGFEVTLKRPYKYILPSLRKCRQHWDDKFGGPYDWPVEKTQEEIPYNYEEYC